MGLMLLQYGEEVYNGIESTGRSFQQRRLRGIFPHQYQMLGIAFRQIANLQQMFRNSRSERYKKVLRNCSHVYLILSVIICKYNLQLHLIYGFKK